MGAEEGMALSIKGFKVSTLVAATWQWKAIRRKGRTPGDHMSLTADSWLLEACLSCDHPQNTAGGEGGGTWEGEWHPPYLILSCIIHEFTAAATDFHFHLRSGVVWASFQNGREM